MWENKFSSRKIKMRISCRYSLLAAAARDLLLTHFSWSAFRASPQPSQTNSHFSLAALFTYSVSRQLCSNPSPINIPALVFFFFFLIPQGLFLTFTHALHSVTLVP